MGKKLDLSVYDQHAPTTPKKVDLSAFDKHAPQTSPEDISKTESALRGAAEYGSLGFADELTGAVQHPVGALEAIINQLSSGQFDDSDALGEYRKERDESRAAYKAAEEANPLTFHGTGLATALAVPIPGLTELNEARVGAEAFGAFAPFAKAVHSGVQAGAVGGLGSSEKDTAAGTVEDVGSGALTGGLFGGLLHGASKAVSGASGVFKDSRFGKNVADSFNLGKKEADVFTSAKSRATQESLEHVAKTDLMDALYKGPLKAVKADFENAKLKAEQQGKVGLFDDIVKKFDDKINEISVKGSATDKDIEELNKIRDSMGQVSTVKSKGQITPDMINAGIAKASSNLSKVAAKGETALVNQVRSQVASETTKAHSKMVSAIEDGIASLNKKLDSARKQSDAALNKASNQGASPLARSKARQQHSLKQAEIAQLESNIAELRGKLASAPELDLSKVKPAADAKAQELLDTRTAEMLQQDPRAVDFKPTEISQRYDDLSGDLIVRASMEGVGEIPKRMSSEVTVKAPELTEKIVGRGELSPSVMDETLRLLQDTELSTGGTKEASSVLQKSLKDSLYGKDLRTLAEEAVDRELANVELPKSQPLNLAKEREDLIVKKMNQMKAEGMTTTQDTLSAKYAQRQALFNELGIPLDKSGDKFFDALKGVPDDLIKVFRKAAEDTASTEAVKVDNMRKLAQPLIDSGHVDGGKVDEVINTMRQLTRRKQLQDIAEKKGFNEGSFDPLHPKQTLSTLAKMGRSTDAQIVRQSANLGALSESGVAKTGKAILRGVEGMFNWPSNKVQALGDKLAAQKSSFGPTLQKIAGEQDERKRRALLFALSQQPAFREIFSKNDSGE